MLHSALVFCAGGNDIYAGGVYIGVSKNIGKLGDILFQAVKGTGEQMAQVVREYLAWTDLCLFAQCLHISPYIYSAHGLASPCEKDGPRDYILLLCVTEQLFLQVADYKYAAVLALTAYRSFSLVNCLDGYILQFADADARPADGLDNKV